MKSSLPVCFFFIFTSPLLAQKSPKMNAAFEKLAKTYVKEFPAFSPVSATQLGDHRFDAVLDDVSAKGRERERAFCQNYLKRLAQIERGKLSRANQVDFSLLEQRLHKRVWELESLEEWAWNPLLYTELAGSGVYHLMARDYAPTRERLRNVTARLKQLPRFLEQVRGTLVVKRVPRIHAETAIKQNKGILGILENMVRPQLDKLSPSKREELTAAMRQAESAIEEHQTWLEETLLPGAKGDFRLGPKLYDQKLRFALGTPLSREDVRSLAERELERVRVEMYELAKKVYCGAVSAHAISRNAFAASISRRSSGRLSNGPRGEIPPADGIVNGGEAFYANYHRFRAGKKL